MLTCADPGVPGVGRFICPCAKRRGPTELCTVRVCTWRLSDVRGDVHRLVYKTKWTFRSGEAGKEAEQATKADGRTAIAGARHFEISEVTIGRLAVGHISIQESPEVQGGVRPSGVERPDPRIIGQETDCEIGVDADPVHFHVPQSGPVCILRTKVSEATSLLGQLL